jgi:uncharacterized protein YhjY with autotransporter beta-barrel domain
MLGSERGVGLSNGTTLLACCYAAFAASLVSRFRMLGFYCRPLLAITPALCVVIVLVLGFLPKASNAQPALWTSTCDGCHGTPPGLPQVNGGNARSILDQAIAIDAGGAMGAFSGLTGAQRDTLVAYIGSTFSATQSASVNYQSSSAITLQNVALAAQGSAVVASITASAPSRGTLPASPFATVSPTYTHTASSCTGDSFTFVGNGSGGSSTSTRTVNISINPPAAPIATASSATINYNALGATNIPLTLSGGPVGGITITTGLSPNVGTLNVVGNTVTYTASNTTYASTVTFQYRANGPTACGTQSGIVQVTINVNPPPAPVITSSLAQTVAGGVPVNYTITADNAPTSFNATGLPAGLSINTGNGQITGTPTVTGVFNVPISAANGTGTDNKVLVLTVQLPTNPPVVTSAGTAAGTGGQAFGYQIAATNIPTSFGASGLPAGVTVNTANGLISGTPTVTGTFNATVTATNGIGTGNRAVTITINLVAPVITSAPTATGGGGQPFSYQTTAGNLPTSFNATGLPAGLSVNTGTGLISGTPTVTGSFPITVTATNGAGTSPPFTLTITIAFVTPVITSPTTATGQGGVPFSYQIAANFLPQSFNAVGPAPTFALPAGLTVNTTTGLISGTPTVNGGTFNILLSAINTTGTGIQTLVLTLAAATLPTAGATTVTTDLNTAITVNMTPLVTGFGVAGVNIVTQPRYGTASASGMSVTYTPRNNFFGQDTFTYASVGLGGTSAPGTVTVNVIGRPDPTKDPSVIGLLAAQADTARRFATAQISNFQRRLESLRRSNSARDERSSAGGSAVARSEAQSPRNNVAAMDRESPMAVFNDNARNGASSSQQGGHADRPLSGAYSNEAPVRLAALDTGVRSTDSPGAGLSLPSFVGDLVSIAKSRSINVAQLAGGSRGTEALPLGSRSVSYWIDGTVSFGSRDATGTRNASDFTTSGVSAGVDYRVTEKLVLGVGVGFARDRTDIGTDGTRSRSQGYSAAAYGSYQPTQNTFIDGLIGAGSLHFDTDRFVPAANDFARANRDGTQFFGALIGGYEYRRNGMLWSPYGRVDFTVNRLNQTTESGAGLNALTYFAQTQKSLQGALGLRVESAHEASFGWVVPRMRAEYRYDSQGEQLASISYADQIGTGPRYTLATGPLDRSATLVGLGSDFILRNGLTLGVDYQMNYSSAQSRSQTVRVRLQMDLDGKVRKPGFLDAMGAQGPLDLQFDGGYTFDDNVNRASNRAERLLDQSFSANLSNNWMFPVSDHVRALATAIVGGEKFKNFDGLSRASAGVTGELQYRTSAAFTASTLAVFGKAFIERFDSDKRDGHRYSIGTSILQPLTDRISVFGALAHDVRYAKSDVFEGKHNSARLNVDYALHKDGTLYMGGEYRRGDTVSTALPTLANLDIAKVFTQDDVFGRGLTSYRIDAKTWIGSVGYNLGFGPRNSLDISWRLAQSTPLQSVSFVAPGFRYVVNQFNLVYLMRF